MRRILGGLFVLFLVQLTASAQSISNASVSTDYNRVTVTEYASAGWSGDACDSENPLYAYSNYLSDFWWQVVGSPVNFSYNVTQTRFAPNCAHPQPDNEYTVQFSFADTSPGTRTLDMTAVFADDGSASEPQAADQVTYTVPGAVARPLYYIVSIVYDPPGNQSSNGFTDSDSNGTSTTTTQTFTTGTTTSFGYSVMGSGNEFSFGSSGGNGSSETTQETHTQGHGSAIRSLYDHIDHTLDHVYLWLNTHVTFVQTGSSSAVYNLSTVDGQPMDVLDFSVANLQNPSQIPPEKCNPHVLAGVTVPGVCNICANPSSCTAADFAPIVAADEFVSGNVTLVPNQCTSNHRYCYISSSYLDAPNPNPVSNSFTESDSNVQTQTFTDTHTYSVGFTTTEGWSVLGAFTLSLRDTTTFSWSDSQSVGSSSGTTNQAQITLSTSTPGCNSGIDIYEDTVYHTFVPVPSGPLPAGCQ